jgi:general secretion pathway protein I
MKSAFNGSPEGSTLFRAPPCEPRPAEAGFTLVEVLVALGILAIALAAIGSLIATNVRGTQSIDTHLTLVETGRAIMTGLPDRNELALGNFSGAIGDQRWRADVVPFIAPNVDPRQVTPWIPQRVVVRMQSPSGLIFQLETIKLRRRGG